MAALAFLAYNFHPARVFMGDSGAMLLGFVIAGVAITGVLKTSAAVAVGLPLVILAIPILDTSFVILKRLKHGLPVYGADRSHFHHRFFTIGWSQRTVLALYAWCGLMSAVALALRCSPAPTAAATSRSRHARVAAAGPSPCGQRTWSTSSRSPGGAARPWWTSSRAPRRPRPSEASA
jgi:UDP-GlcNAc:undecaprenyl-phosphate GlcNAc-1-phosphate transferase